MNIKVVELFAGVGGFRLGLETASPLFQTVWANQWEPKRKAQHAFDCYCYHFGKSDNHINQDIALVKHEVPDHDLLVGGFPCQDYSVAATKAKGIEGEKGNLWWHINDILKAKKPPYVLLENVDRLIKSPSNQRGRDFGIMLKCFLDLGYAVEWRVINAADYGYAQRRRRIFIFAFHKSSNFYQQLADKTSLLVESYHEWLICNGFYANPFPVQRNESPAKQTYITGLNQGDETIKALSDAFTADFHNAGIMHNGDIFSEELTPITCNATTLRQIRMTEEVDSRFFLDGSLDKWNYLKGPKKIQREKPNGEPYFFSEGAISFPDNLDVPSRTILTSESSINRSTHVIEDAHTGQLRLLTPIECERLQGFTDDWTNTGMPERFRYFVMGNALVVSLIARIGKRLLDIV
ncbi:MAG: DNA (cytosine-5-)-methyltransferase [Bacteroidales bacterium]|nr:DNA (cytosine-5-)-methyltransferase [Bacteroidales bacterium]